MAHQKIRLACRIIIDNTSTATWEKYIYEDTYKEYLMQQQLYNSKENPVSSFRELLALNPKAEKLHFLTGIAAQSYLSQFNGTFYRIQDVLGSTFFPFTNYKLDIINTHHNDASKHKIGITFYSPLFTYLGIVNNCYLVSFETEAKQGYETIMFTIQPHLSICYFEGGEFNNLEKPTN